MNCADCPSADICTEWNSKSPPEPAACIADLVLPDHPALYDGDEWREWKQQVYFEQKGENVT